MIELRSRLGKSLMKKTKISEIYIIKKGSIELKFVLYYLAFCHKKRVKLTM